MTHYQLTIQEQTFEVEIGAIQDGIAQVLVDQVPYQVRIDGAGRTMASPLGPTASTQTTGESRLPKPGPSPAPASGSGVVTAPIPGKILHLRVQVGTRVQSGQVVAVMEAMKMENDIVSPLNGAVKEIRSPAGTDVATGDVILVIG